MASGKNKKRILSTKNKPHPSKKNIAANIYKLSNKQTPNKKSIQSKKKINTKIKQNLEKGTKVECQITSIKPTGLQVKITKPILFKNTKGYIDGLEISDDITQIRSPEYKIGMHVKAKVIDPKDVRLSILKLLEESDGVYYDMDINIGDVVIGRINRSVNVDGPCLMLDIRKRDSMVRCCITELMYDPWRDMPLGTYDSNNESKDYGLFEHGTYVQVRIQSQPKLHNKVNIYQGSLRLTPQPSPNPKVNDIIQGYVIHVNEKRCLIRITPEICGVVWVRNISDTFIKNPEKYLPVGKLITAKVVDTVDKIKYTLMLDMKKSTLENYEPPQPIKLNQIYKGVINRVEPYGVFVKVQDMTGFAHISECSEEYIKDLKKFYHVGDLVKVYVLKKEEGKVSISLKKEYFENDDSDSEEDEESDEEEEGVQFVDDSDDDIDVQNLKDEVDNDKGDGSEMDSDHDDSSTSDHDDSDDESSQEQESPIENPPEIDTAFDFEWEMPTKAKQPSDDASTSSESSEEDNLPKNTHKSRKNAAKKQRLEKQISLREQALADGTADLHPETISDLERLITSNPNLSQHYIKYMAYYLSCSDIDAARGIARRALNRIDFRKENEKLNIWTALLALESKYGTPVTFDDTLRQACERNNPKHVYLRVCEMLSRELQSQETPQEQQLEKALKVYQKMIKKFRTKKSPWISYFQFLLSQNKHEEAHTQLKQSLQSLPKYKHIPTLSKFAQFEYDFGSIERGRTIFNTLVESNPKRIDLLFLYVDKEIKTDVERARGIFQNICRERKVKYNDHQMKRLFKKWYGMEEAHGDERFCNEVKIAAKDYVSGSMS